MHPLLALLFNGGASSGAQAQPEVLVDTHDGKRRTEQRRPRHEIEAENRENLRGAVRRAVAKALGIEPDDPPPAAVEVKLPPPLNRERRREIARSLMGEAPEDTTLKDIDRTIREVERRLRDNEAARLAYEQDLEAEDEWIILQAA